MIVIVCWGLWCNIMDQFFLFYYWLDFYRSFFGFLGFCKYGYGCEGFVGFIVGILVCFLQCGDF